MVTSPVRFLVKLAETPVVTPSLRFLVKLTETSVVNSSMRFLSSMTRTVVEITCQQAVVAMVDNRHFTTNYHKDHRDNVA